MSSKMAVNCIPRSGHHRSIPACVEVFNCMHRYMLGLSHGPKENEVARAQTVVDVPSKMSKYISKGIDHLSRSLPTGPLIPL